MAKTAVSTVAGGGVLVYALLRLDASLFFDRLGLTPEDVGLAESELVARAVVIVAVLGVVLLSELWLAVWSWSNVVSAGRLLAQLLRRDGARGGQANGGTTTAAGHGGGLFALPRGAGLALVAVTLVFLEWVVVVGAEGDANRVLRGLPVDGSVGGLPLLPWSARPASVHWTGSAGPRGLEQVAEHCVLFLGQGGGSLYFFDAAPRRLVRVPSGSAAITLDVRPVAPGRSCR